MLARDLHNTTEYANSTDQPERPANTPYAPPSGFDPVILGASDFASDTSELLLDLDCKQVWHISAPATLNLDPIKGLDLTAALQGDTILTHNNVNYSLQEVSVNGEALMLVDGESAKYGASKTKVSKSFKLGVRSGNEEQQPSEKSDANEPEISTPAFFAQHSGQKKLPRQQPEGLKMRYQPFGPGSSTPRATPVNSPSKKSPMKSSNTRPVAGRMTEKGFVITDPMSAPGPSSKPTPRSASQPMMFSSVFRQEKHDIEMEDAPSPSKAPRKRSSPSTSLSEEVKANGTSSKGTVTVDAKKKKRDRPKLVGAVGS